MALAGVHTTVFASDAKAPPPKEKEPNYANEDGVTGRSGAVYKRSEEHTSELQSH